MKRNNFNLVEIIIAMGIVVVCITTIMGLLSVGMNASEDAVEKSYANMIMEQLSGLVETYPDIQDEIPKSTDQRQETKHDATNNDFSAWSGISDSNWNTIQTEEEACTTPVDSKDAFFKNVYFNNGATAGQKMGILKIVYNTRIGSSDVPDFTAFAKLWWNSGSPSVPVSDGGTITLDEGISLNIELTWPYKQQYRNRVTQGNFLKYTKVIQP